MNRPKPPSGLSKESKTLWTEVLDGFEIEQTSLPILLQACESLDRLRQAQAILKTDGLVVRDRFDQPKQHPMLLQERDSRTQFLRCWKALNLDIEAPLSAGSAKRT